MDIFIASSDLRFLITKILANKSGFSLVDLLLVWVRKR